MQRRTSLFLLWAQLLPSLAAAVACGGDDSKKRTLEADSGADALAVVDSGPPGSGGKPATHPVPKEAGAPDALVPVDATIATDGGTNDASVTAPDASDAASLDANLAPLATFAGTVTMTATCGEALAPTADLTVTNGGGSALVIADATADSGFTVVTTLPITIQPGQSAPLTVRPPSPVIGTDLAKTVKAGTLSFHTNEPGSPLHTASLASTVHGANLAIVSYDDTSVPLTSLTASSDSCPAIPDFRIKNTGDRAATMDTPVQLAGFAFSGFSSQPEIEIDTNIVTSLIAFSSDACSASTTLVFTATGPVCSAPLSLPASWTVTGATGACCS